MDIFFAVMVFVAISLISDAIEGKRKKRQQGQLPPTTADTPQPPQTPSSQSRPRVVIPPIKGAPAGRQNNTKVSPPVDRPVDTRYMAALTRPQKQSGKEVADPLQVSMLPTGHTATDIHTDVLLNAIAYAQILQPPKAYQYMATRSCRGDWQNNK